MMKLDYIMFLLPVLAAHLPFSSLPFQFFLPPPHSSFLPPLLPPLLPVFEQEALSIDVHQMMKDELQWLGSVTKSPRLEFQNLLAGHLRLCQALFTCEGIDKKQYGMVAMVTHIL